MTKKELSPEEIIEIVDQYEKLMYKIANKYRSLIGSTREAWEYGDFISVLKIALLQHAQTFNADLGNQFMTYVYRGMNTELFRELNRYKNSLHYPYHSLDALPHFIEAWNNSHGETEDFIKMVEEDEKLSSYPPTTIQACVHSLTTSTMPETLNTGGFSMDAEYYTFSTFDRAVLDSGNFGMMKQLNVEEAATWAHFKEWPPVYVFWVNQMMSGYKAFEIAKMLNVKSPTFVRFKLRDKVRNLYLRIENGEEIDYEELRKEAEYDLMKVTSYTEEQLEKVFSNVYDEFLDYLYQA